MCNTISTSKWWFGIPCLTFRFFLFFSHLTLKGREAKCANLLAENDIITPEGMKANLSYTLVTQREPDNQVH